MADSDSEASNETNITEEELQKEIVKILEKADLQTTSTNKVIQKLEKKLGVSLTEKKKLIDRLVLDYVNSLDSSDSEEEDEKKSDSEKSEEEQEKKPRVKEEKDEDYGDAVNSTENTIDNTADNDAVNAGIGNTDVITTPNKIQLPATRPGRKKTTEQDQLTTDILRSVKQHLKRPAPASVPEDRYDLLGRSIAMKLRSLDKCQRLIAEKIINDTLFDAEMGNLDTEGILNRRSFTFVSSPTPSLSRTPSPSHALVQQYCTEQYTHTTSVAPQIQPWISPIQQYVTQEQTTSPALQRQPSPALHEEFDTKPTTATFHALF